LLNKALAENLPMFARDGGFIEVGYHAELDRFKALKDERRQLIAELQKKYIDDSGINSIKIKHNNVLGYFVEVTSLHAPKLNSQEAFIHRQTMTNATRFTTIELKELERDLSQAADRALAIEQECLANGILVRHQKHKDSMLQLNTIRFLVCEVIKERMGNILQTC